MSQAQTPSGSALGLPYNPDEDADGDLSGMLSDDPQPGDTTEEEAPPKDDPSSGVFGDEPGDDEPAAAPAPAAAEAAADETEAPEGEEEVAETVTFAGREQTMQQAEAQFREMARGFTDLVQANRQAEANAQVQAADMERMRAEQEQVRQFLLQQAAEADPEVAARLQQDQATAALVDQRLQSELEPLRQQQQRQQDEANQRQQLEMVVGQAREAVQGFYARNGITQGDERDNATLHVFQQLSAAGAEVDMTNPQHLDYALAVAEGRIAPPLGVIPQGVGAGQAPVPGATVASASAAPGNGAPAQPKAPARRRVEAHVETGGSGAPASTAPGAQPDEFDEAFSYYQGRKQRGPLFGSTRT